MGLHLISRSSPSTRRSSSPGLRQAVYALIGVVAYTVVYFFITTFTCTSIKGSWDLLFMATAKCFDKLTLYLVRSIFNIAIDTCTLVLPLHMANI